MLLFFNIQNIQKASVMLLYERKSLNILDLKIEIGKLRHFVNT